MLSPGDQLGRYVIEAEIGSGSLSRVYRARDPLAGRMVAVKTLRSELLARPAADACRQRIEREAHAAGRLSHANVVRIFDGGEACLVMELLNGVLLSNVLRNRPVVPVEETLGIVGPIADALDHAHARGVIHRDVKPQNVMVLRDGSPRLLDFGRALFVGETAAPGDKFLATPAYMAPEQIAEGTASPLTDQFALAVLAYQMLTGARPFDGDNLGAITYRVVFAEPEPPSLRNLRLPAEFDEVFARALAKDPAARFASASAFVKALSAHAELARRTAAPLSPIARRRRVALEDTVALGPPVPGAPLTASPVRPADLAATGAVRRKGRRRRPQPSVEAASASSCAIQIESEPAGATVAVDGRLVGVTPIAVMDLQPGTHTVRVSEEGFSLVQMLIDLWPSAVAPRIRVALQPMPQHVRPQEVSMLSMPVAGGVVMPGSGSGKPS
ncbi:MAG TPA: serine/threonine-protein kinase [Vicinamibacteria bacterium]|nr:serine/threonine-protein kinase [Vicinamibacteria bacterium]